jgi:hypothetical protein
MTQDPDRQGETQDQDGVLTSHALDMVTLFQSSTVDAEMEADMIRGILDSNGIPAILSDTPYAGVLGAEVKVPRGRLKEAQKLIADAQAAGPEAAAEAEAASEEK